MALVRMFGATPQERSLDAGDVHVPQGKRLEELGEVTISIEVRIALPELAKAPKSCAAIFNQMVDVLPLAPACRNLEVCRQPPMRLTRAVEPRGSCLHWS